MKSKSFRTNAALILTTLMLVVAAGTTASAQIYTDVYDFDGNHGAYPDSILTQGRDGNLYGTTSTGGGKTQGVVFGITPSGTLKGAYRFDGGTNGGSPRGGVTLGTDGAFYGTTNSGGNSLCYRGRGCGTVFKITNSGSLTTLYTFTGGADGGGPLAPPVQGVDGNFYGTTNYGTAYRITSSGTFTPLGLLPSGSYAPLLQASDGKFYGTTYNGGTYNTGTVFEMTAKGVVTIVHSFDGADGENPASPVIQGGDGNFYGTTLGGPYCDGGNGTVFMLTPQGSLTVLHNFPDPNYPNDGACPSAGLMQATDGNFYGGTGSGGVEYGSGVIFQITPAGNYSILYYFDGSGGARPLSSVMQHTNGKIYGTAANAGALGYGAVFSLDMGLGPFVRLVSPAGKVGKTVEVLGQGFTGTTGVSFNGTAANFKVVSDTFLGAEVPSGAATGPVTVTTPSGTLTSNKPFIVIP